MALLHYLDIPGTSGSDKIRTISHMSKFIIATSKKDQKNHNQLLFVLNHIHMINSVLIYEENHETHLKIANLFGNYSHKVLKPNEENLNAIFFPDKLKNVNGFKYKFLSIPAPPFATFINGKLYCEFCYFIKILEKHMKITPEIVELGANVTDFVNKGRAFIKEAFYARSNLRIYLHIYNFLAFFDRIPKLMTYESSQDCFLVTEPPKIPMYEQIMIRPFDLSIWIFLTITMAFYMLVW